MPPCWKLFEMAFSPGLPGRRATSAREVRCCRFTDEAYMMRLSTRQQQIFQLIQRYIEEEGYPPTGAEIVRKLGFRSLATVEDQLQALQRQGVIEWQRETARGIRLLEACAVPEGLPVVGAVAAGCPILAAEHVEEYYRLDPDLFHPRADYLLRVSGMSMCEAGILDGDLLAVHRTPEARNGQIVVARLDDEVTVKRWYRDEDARYRVRLHSENAEFAPISVDLRQQSLVIEGLGVGIMRNDRASFSAKSLAKR
jgi:repressor LexA